MKSPGRRKLRVLLVFVMAIAGYLHAQQLAFPSAEGYGKFTKGGNGGKIIIVKSLDEFGSAVNASGPKTIVFRVSGEVKSPGTIPSGTTILGQTAPGDGITIRGGILLQSNVILRYIRVRGPAADNIGAIGKNDIILDHVSASWSADESVSIYHCKNVTIQWTLIAEPFGTDHAFIGIWGGPNNTYHHNLLAHAQSRCPRFCSGSGNNDFRNNVLYNWERNTIYGGEAKDPGGCVNCEDYSHINIVANYYKYGPSVISEPLKCRIVDPWGSTGYGKYYITDNYVWGYPEVTADNWDGGKYGGVQVVGDDILSGDPTIKNDRSMKADEPASFMPINQQTAEKAYESVLQHVGCSFPNRDKLDKNIIEEVRTGTASRGKDGKGILYSTKEIVVPKLRSRRPPKDSDNDGIPDKWEKKHGLNPNNPSDANEIGKDGFTNLIIYSESIVSSMFALSPK